MRILMWFGLGFAASCALLAYGIGLPLWIPLVLFAGMFGAGFRWKKLRPGAVLAIGCCVGILWFGFYSRAYLSDAAALDGKTMETEIQITDYSVPTNYGCSADGVITIGQKSYRVRVYVNRETTLEPGDTVSGTFRFRLTSPGAAEEITYYSGKGIFLMAYSRGSVTFGEAAEEHWRCMPSRLRQSIRDVLKRTFPERTHPFAQALLIGDSDLLPYGQDIAFQISGIRHVIAVSGLHVSVLFALISMITFRKRFLTALIGIPLLAVFAAAAGFSPSVSRACLMSGLMLLSQLTEKEYDGPTSLAFAVLTMTVVNPMVVTAVGFQLSVCSVAGIFLCYTPVNSWILDKLGREKGRTWKSRMKSAVSSSVAMSISASVLTTPLCAYYFGMVSLIAVLTNLLLLWLILPVFMGIVCVCAMALFWQTGAVVLAKLVSIPMMLILWVTGLLSRFPLAAVYTTQPFIVLWLVGTYLGLAVFMLRKRRNPVHFASWVGIGLSAALVLGWLIPQQQESRITVLDVGQGQCILLQSGERTFLVDCGGDYDSIAGETAAKTLLGRGITCLDGVIVTHYDRDHMGGIPYLLSWVDTDLLILPDTDDRGKREALTGETVLVSDTLTLEDDSMKLTVFGPVYSGYSNENSLCILFETENCAILITGDRSGFGERMLLRQYSIPDVDILVAGHHGSGDSTTQELLDVVTPETVLISLSEDNNYGHPDPMLLERLTERGIEVFRTDVHGTIDIRR